MLCGDVKCFFARFTITTRHVFRDRDAIGNYFAICLHQIRSLLTIVDKLLQMWIISAVSDIYLVVEWEVRGRLRRYRNSLAEQAHKGRERVRPRPIAQCKAMDQHGRNTSK